MPGFIPVLLLVSASADAATFDERVDRATALFETEAGAIYEKKLRPTLQETFGKCVSADAESRKDYGKFVLVADVSADGEISNAVVQPETKASTCFSKEFSARVLPAPPASIISEGFAPIVVEIYIVP